MTGSPILTKASDGVAELLKFIAAAKAKVLYW
jgi:hypothetical protein